MSSNKPNSDIVQPADSVRDFVETLDKLAYEKPAGFTAYLVTCMSSGPNIDFSTQKTEAVRDKNE